MHRFFLTDAPLTPKQPVDLSLIAHQLRSVLRLRPGMQITLLDGQNHAFLTEITQLDQTKAMGQILTQETLTTEPSVHLTLYQCSLKADKFEWVLQKGTELGVARFVPVVSERSVVRPIAALHKKRARWANIVREAAEQCGRGVLPEITEPLKYSQALDHAYAHAADLSLLSWEEANTKERETGLGARLQQEIDNGRSPQKISILIGPEGGFSAQEIDRARESGWQIVSLGGRILRAETASVAAISIIMDRFGELGDF